MSTKNVGWLDAGIRAAAAGLLLAASAAVPQHPLVALGIGFIAVVFIGSALFRVCPLYTLLRINTCSRSNVRVN